MTTDPSTLVDAFRKAWSDPAWADRQALRDAGRSLTYQQLHQAVGHLAGGLRAAGIGEGARVALAMPRSIDLALAILGVMAAGACPCPLEPRLGPEETDRRYRLARIDWTLVDRNQVDDPVISGTAASRVLVYQGLAEAPPHWAEHLSPMADSFLLFTSGSSGKPKGVLQNHQGMLTNANGVIARTGLGPDDRLLHIMPLYHTNGVNNQLLAPLLAGATVILAERFRAEEMPQLLARYRPTILTGVPTIYSRMLPFEYPPESLASLRMLRCGSAPITQELHRQIEMKFGKPLVVSYGLSEATCTSTMNPPAVRRIGSVGTPLPGQAVFLRASDGTRITRAGQDGEICIGGPVLMTGYLEEGCDGMARPVGEALGTGDLGRFDADGYLFITGRIKDVIIRGGENLSPNLIEEVIVKIPGVQACCVVGRADADLGEVPVAFIVRAQGPDGERLDPAQLDGAILQGLSRIHRPAEYFFVPGLPENSVGKVDRKQLAQSLVSR